jgi:hypothetical protein
MRQLLFASIILIVSLVNVTAQTPTPYPTSFPSPMATPPAFSGRSTYETQLGWGILVFGFLVIGLQVLVMLRLKKGWGTQSIRVVGLTLVLTSGLFLIVTGYSQEQIAPMIGLLGTITGFLLGKTTSPNETA